MIEGITVLAEITDKIPWWQILLLALISAIVCGLGASMIFDLSVKVNLRVSIIGCVIIFILVFGLTYIINKEKTPTYKVLIDENVSLKEFDELYEIVGHDGDIVLIKIKENIKE